MRGRDEWKEGGRTRGGWAGEHTSFWREYCNCFESSCSSLSDSNCGMRCDCLQQGETVRAMGNYACGNTLTILLTPILTYALR